MAGFGTAIHEREIFFGEKLVIDFIKEYKVRQVFPKPYTFETAPVALKVRGKHDGQIEVARLEIQESSVDAAYRFSLFAYRAVRFDELLENWEQLDGWPCGTFDGEDEK